MKFVGLVILVSMFFQKSCLVSLGHSLPKSFRQCRKSDPYVGKCLQEALGEAFKKMKTGGIPSLGVLPLEPLVVNDIKIDPGANGPVTLKLHFTNLKMYGIPESNITEYEANFKDARLTSTALTSKLWFEADYTADGKVLLLPVKGSGKCNVTLFNLKTTTDLKFHPEKKNGETYWIIQSFKNKFTPKKVTVYFDGLLKGERRLNSGINQFLNDNWKVVFEELGPSFEDAFGAVFKEITHRVFSRMCCEAFLRVETIGRQHRLVTPPVAVLERHIMSSNSLPDFDENGRIIAEAARANRFLLTLPQKSFPLLEKLLKASQQCDRSDGFLLSSNCRSDKTNT